MRKQTDSDTNPALHCLRCGYWWMPRIGNVLVCPKCKSPYWNTPRKVKEPKE